MNPSTLLRHVLCALLLGLSAMAVSAQEADTPWQALIDQQTNLVNQGNYQQALVIAQQSLDFAKQTFGEEHPNTLTSLNNLALNYSELGLYDKALPLNQQTYEARKRVLSEQHPDTLTSLNNLAQNYSNLGQYDKAIPLGQQVYEMHKRVLDSEHPDTLTILSNLAYYYWQNGQYDKALPLNQQTYEVRKRVLGEQHPDTLTSLNNLAQNYSNLGQYDKTIPLGQQVYEMKKRILGAEHPKTLTSLNNLAYNFSELGQYERALNLSQEVYEARKRVLGVEHPDTLISLLNLAHNYLELGQYDKALPLNQQAYETYKRTLGVDHPDTIRCLHNLAQNYSRLGQYGNSLSLNRRVYEASARVLGEQHPYALISLSDMAHDYSQLGQYDKALTLALEALIFKESTLGSDHPSTALGWGNFSEILEKKLEPTSAITALKRAVNIYQHQRERVSGINKEALDSYTHSVSGTYQSLARILTEQGRLAEAQQVLDMLKETEQFDFVRRSGDADPRKSRVGYTPSEQSWMRRYDDIAEKVAALGAEDRALKKIPSQELTPQQKARQKALVADLAVAQKAFEDYLGHMRENLASKGPARAVEVAETSVQALRATQALIRSLGDDVVLLQYYVTDDQVGMLLTTAGTQLARHSMVKVAELNRQIFALNSLLRDPKANPLLAAQALYQLLLAPVSRDLEEAGAKTVMLSLDGTLRYVPFGVLHDGRQHALQRWQLPLYTSVVRDKLRDAPSQQWQAAGLGMTRATGEFAALPAVRGEIASIVRVQGQGAGVVPGEVYLDDTFNAARLKDVGRRPFQLMHVASHFRFSPGTEVNSFLLLGDGARLTLGDLRTQNYRFDNVDLLTLSACETGLGGGRNEKGQEIEGFGVIAQQQGAKAVLATLWPVADQSTATLMADMYRRRQEQQLSKIEALRQAQISLLSQSKYAHPFYWAPFVLMGNWK